METREIITAKNIAFTIAKQSFKEKKDKAGKPYINHLLRVADKFKDDPKLYVISLLHDLLEDCPEWNTKSLNCIFSDEIVEAVELLTKDKDLDYYEYIDLISKNEMAKAVKISDLEDNLDVKRLDSIGEADLHRINKYLTAYKKLKK